MEKPDTVVAVGAVGDDYAKGVCLKAMKERGVNALYKVIPKEGTGFRVIYDNYNYNTETMESCRWTIPRAGEKFKHEYLEEADTAAAVKKISWLYLDFGSVWADLYSARDLALKVHSEGQKVMVNISHTDFIKVEYHHAWDALLGLADVIVMNRDAAECIDQENRVMGNRDWERGVKSVARRVPEKAEYIGMPLPGIFHKYIVVTNGGNDIAICDCLPYELDKMKISYVKATPAEKPEYWQYMPRDRRGVGDLFAGGLVAALAQGKPIEEAVTTGHKLAAYSLNHEGWKLPPKDGEAPAEE